MSKLSECLPLQETTNIRPLVWLLAVLCDKCSSRDLVYFHRIAQCDLLPVPVAIPLSVSLSFCSGRCFSVPVHVAVFPSLSLSLCPFPCPRLSVPVPVFSARFFALFPSLCPSVAVPVPLSLSLLNRDKNRDGEGEKGVAKYLIAEHKCSPECGSVNGYTSLHSRKVADKSLPVQTLH